MIEFKDGTMNRRYEMRWVEVEPKRYEENLSDVATRNGSQMTWSSNGDVVHTGLSTMIKKMCSSCVFIVMIMFGCVYICEGTISDKRLCGDPTCSGLYVVRTFLGLASCLLRIIESLKIIRRALCQLLWI
jgi:hypothetical protein